MNRKFDPNSNLELLAKESNIAGQQMYSQRAAQEVKVQILPDKSVGPAKFIPNQTMPGTYRAHPLTIAAMREDLFANMHNEAFEELSVNIDCEGCKRVIDMQFWKFCPYCETKFPQKIS